MRRRINSGPSSYQMSLVASEYETHAAAGRGTGIHPHTIWRWIKRGWLHWPVGAKVGHDHLLAMRDYIDESRYDVFKAIAKGRQKYHTREEASRGKYESVKRYRQANRLTVNRDDKQSKALKRHPLFQEMKAEMLEYYGWRCLACRVRKSACMDHVRPLSQFGENHPRNLQPLCISCNTSKRDAHTDYRPDKGKWLNIRWGGWAINGEKGTINGSIGRRSLFVQRHWDRVLAWRRSYADNGGELSPTEYKLSKAPQAV